MQSRQFRVYRKKQLSRSGVVELEQQLELEFKAFKLLPEEVEITTRLARECAKLDPDFESNMADEGLWQGIEVIEGLNKIIA